MVNVNDSSDSWPTDTTKLPTKVRVLVEDPSPWFIAADVCTAIGMPTARITGVPKHARKKAATEDGKLVHLVNSEGLLYLLAWARINAASRTRLSVHTSRVYDDRSETHADPLGARQVEAGAAIAIEGALRLYPQRVRTKLPDGVPILVESPRAKREAHRDKTEQISEGVSDKP